MKILYVATISSTINAFLVPHIKTLLSEGYQVDIACHFTDQNKQDFVELGCTVFDVPFERSPFNRLNLEAYKQMDSILSMGQYDIIHTHTPVASAIVRFVSRKYKDTMVFYTAHGFHFFKGAPLFNWLVYFPTEFILSWFTDLIITINSEDFDRVNKYFKRRSNDIVYVKGVGIDLSKFTPLNQEEKAKLRRLNDINPTVPVLIYVGELSYRKNQAFLLDVIAMLTPETELLLLLVGDGSEHESLKQRAIELGLEANVRFLGHRYDVPKLFGLSDICVSSSRQEGLAVNLMEAMATRLPLVVTDVRGNRDLVEQNVNGNVVAEHDVQGFASQIKDLINNREKAVKMSREGRRMVEELDIHSINQTLLQLYKEREVIPTPDVSLLKNK